MRSSLPTAPAVRGGVRSGPRRVEPRAVIVSLVPVGPAVGLLRRSNGAPLAEGPLGSSRRPPLARVPAESRLVFRSGVVRAG